MYVAGGFFFFGGGMVVYANIVPAAQADGIVYSATVPLTSSEADLFNGAEDDPVQVLYGEAVLAIVKFIATGEMGANSSYVVMQTDLAGNGIWVDVAWCLWTGLAGQATFVLSGGVAGANAFQQSRAPGTAPGSNGSNQIPLGGRVRFVGKAIIGSGSSVSSSTSLSIGRVTASIFYKLLGLR